MSKPQPPLIDAHCHPDAFGSDEWGDVVRRASKVGVRGCVAAGLWPDQFERLLKSHSAELVARVHTRAEFVALFQAPEEFHLMACLGLHPMEVARRWRLSSGEFARPMAERDVLFFVETARNYQALVWAVGEAGFDASEECLLGWSSKEQLLEAQDFAFEVSVKLAVELGVPLVVHSRCAWGHTLNRLQAAKKIGLGQFMVHCYPGSASDLQRLERMGGFASFGGVMTWPNAKRMREALRLAPSGSYLIETDSPDLAPAIAGFERIVRNEPKYLKPIAEVAAQLRGESLDDVIRSNFENLQRYFLAVK